MAVQHTKGQTHPCNFDPLTGNVKQTHIDGPGYQGDRPNENSTHRTGGVNALVRDIPAARPLADTTSAIFRDASSIISSPSITAPTLPPASDVQYSYASRISSAWS